MRFDRRAVELRDLVGGRITATDYHELTVEKGGKAYKVEFDVEYGYYDECTPTIEITEIHSHSWSYYKSIPAKRECQCGEIQVEKPWGKWVTIRRGKLKR
jgi:hypothetical protein